MFELIMHHFKGAHVTIGLTGLPVVLTGEVFESGAANVVGLRLDGGVKVFLNAEIIAFVF